MLILIFGISVILILASVFSFAKPSISTRKTRLMNLYSSVLSDMNVDYRDAKIGVQNIRDISTSIVHLSEEITKMSKGISEESEENQKWLVDLIREFSRELDLWMGRHASELEIVTDTLSDTVTESPALDLMTTRLQTQIDVLDRARIRI